jgi:hypothetical protein
MKKAGKTVMTVRATVSPDGKTRGQDVNNASGSSNFTGPRVALRFCGKLSACQRNEQNPIKHNDRPINSKRRLPAVQHRIRKRNRPARMSMGRFTRLTNGFRARSWRTTATRLRCTFSITTSAAFTRRGESRPRWKRVWPITFGHWRNCAISYQRCLRRHSA